MTKNNHSKYIFKSKFLLLFWLLFSFIFSVSLAHAVDCDYVGQCVENKRCVRSAGGTIVNVGADCGSSVIGGVAAPRGTNLYNRAAGGDDQIGIIVFASRAIRLITIIAGVFIMFNFIKAGFLFLNAGTETKATGEVRDLLTYSLIGLVVIALAYTIAGLIGLIFFGNAGYIINPELVSVFD